MMIDEFIKSLKVIKFLIFKSMMSLSAAKHKEKNLKLE